MINLKLNKERYTAIQLLIMVASIVVYVFLSRATLTQVEGWINLLIYVVFNVSIMLSGQKLGSHKEVLRRLYAIIDGEGAAELKLNEALHMLKMAAATAGICFEEYNKDLPKKIRRQQKRLIEKKDIN